MEAPASESSRYARINEIFQRALDLAPAERAAFLERECGSDHALRREVEAFLAADGESDGFLESPVASFPADLLANEEDGAPVGRQFGAYRVIREIGRGGLGVVYLAARADDVYRKEVAIKLIRRGLDTDDILRRFRNERQILAQLEHPNIARLIDGGTSDDGLPYFVLEHVKGEPISDYAETRKLSTAERLELFRKVCAAVTYAHQNLVIHRDLKPSNILVTAEGEPKLLDFGIAKLLTPESELLTLTAPAERAMTPEYASPEQIKGERITTASDVYSLGVLLYELLTGRKPYRLKTRTREEISRAITDQEPERPSTAAQPERGRLNGDLDNIVLMAMRKEPARRYASAAALAEDIRRYQQGLPVTARPNTFSYRAGKFVRRHRLGVAAAALVLLAIVGGIVATLWQARIARAERATAEKRFNDVRSLAGSFLFEFSPLIENLPGSVPARELLVRRALEYLDRLSRDAAGDLELQREVAAAYAKVGDVQGNPYSPNLGDTRGALQSYEKARAIRQMLWERNPADSRAQGELADVLKLIGDVHSNGGDYAKAIGAYDRALELREAIVARSPGDFEARASLAVILRARGIISFYESRNQEAAQFYTRARDLNEQLQREQPDNATIADRYAYSFVAIGEAQGWDEDYAGSAENLQRGLDLLTALAVKHPHDDGIQRSFMLALQKRAELHQEFKEHDRSLALYARAAEVSEKRVAADPRSIQAKRDLAMTNKKYAQALDAAGESRASLQRLQVALSTFQELAAADPANTEHPYDVANTRHSIGETHLTLKEHEAALRCFQQAKDEYAAVLERNPTNTYAVRMSSYNFDRTAKSYAALAEKGNREEYLRHAIENWRAALDGFERLKKSGKLGEIDSKVIGETEQAIAYAEAALAQARGERSASREEVDAKL